VPDPRLDSVDGATRADAPDESGREPAYHCDCIGFEQNYPERFCLRCLTVWVEGLPGVCSGSKLDAEMRRAGRILARRVKDDPDLGKIRLVSAVRAAEPTHQ
jgi:hypothetical protein